MTRDINLYTRAYFRTAFYIISPLNECRSVKKSKFKNIILQLYVK